MQITFERKERYLNAIVDDGNLPHLTLDIPLNQSYFSITYLDTTKPRDPTGYTIYNQASGGQLYISILDIDAGNIDDNEGVVFTKATFESFLRTFTSMTQT